MNDNQPTEPPQLQQTWQPAQSIPPAATEPNQPQNGLQMPHDKILVLAVVVILVIIVAGGAYYLSSAHKATASTQSTTYISTIPQTTTIQSPSTAAPTSTITQSQTTPYVTQTQAANITGIINGIYKISNTTIFYDPMTTRIYSGFIPDLLSADLQNTFINTANISASIYKSRNLTIPYAWSVTYTDDSPVNAACGGPKSGWESKLETLTLETNSSKLIYDSIRAYKNRSGWNATSVMANGASYFVDTSAPITFQSGCQVIVSSSYVYAYKGNEIIFAGMSDLNNHTINQSMFITSVLATMQAK